MNPRSFIQQCSYLSVLFFVSYVVCLFQCVYCMFSAMAVLSPPPRRWVCLFSHRELLYLCVLFFIFLYGYLLHYVVYNTVVCINTIIYFSMEKKDSKANYYEPGKMRLQHTEVCFSNKQNVFLWEIKRNSHPASLKIGTCDLSASILMLV